MYIIEQKSTTIRSYQFNFTSIKILVCTYSFFFVKSTQEYEHFAIAGYSVCHQQNIQPKSL